MDVHVLVCVHACMASTPKRTAALAATDLFEEHLSVSAVRVRLEDDERVGIEVCAPKGDERRGKVALQRHSASLGDGVLAPVVRCCERALPKALLNLAKRKGKKGGGGGRKEGV